MQWILAGLGNREKEYEGTRHNVGRDFLTAIAKKEGVEKWNEDKKLRARLAKGIFFGEKALVVLPETMMNNSGLSLKGAVSSKKQAEHLAVLHDDLDLPLGRIKLSFGSGAGGHKGVDSVQRALNTRNFVRIRIGISPSTPKGSLRRPDSSEIIDFVLGKFKSSEQDKLKKARVLAARALELLLSEGLSAALNEINSK